MRLANRLLAIAAALLVLGGPAAAAAAVKAPAPKAAAAKKLPVSRPGAPVAWPGDMSQGDPRAPIEVVEYASLSCPHCAHFNAEVFAGFKAKYIDTGKAHFAMREFLTPPANLAAAGWLLARCAAPAKYFSVVDGVFKSQCEWVEGADIRGILLKVATDNGLSEAQFEACLKSEPGLKALNERVRRAVDVEKVEFTPTVEVNGKRMDDAPQSLADLDAAIAAAPKKPAPRPRRR